MAKRLRYILNLSYIIRHLQSSFVYVTQTDRSIPPEMRESLVEYEMNIKKDDKGYRILTIKKRKSRIDRYGREFIDFIPINTIGRIPLTKLPWDGHFIPQFDFDIDLDEAWSRLVEYNSLKVRDVAPDIINELVEEAREKNEKDTRSKYQHSKDKRDEAIDRFKEMRENNEYKTKSHAASILAKEFEMSFSWAYNLIVDLWDD